MTELKIDKTNWKLVKFGDVVYEPKETVRDLVVENIEHVVGLEHIDTDDIHLRKSASVAQSTTFTKKFAKGDVLFGRRRAYLRKAAQAQFEGICSGDITVFRAKPALSVKLLPFVVNNDAFFDYAVKHSAGGLSPRVKFRDLADYEFLLPPPEEQEKLAELLWAMDEVIENNIKLKDNIIVLRSSFYKTISNHKNLHEKKDFKVLKIKEFSKVQTGATPLRSSLHFFQDGIFHWVKTLDLNNGAIFTTEEKISAEAIKKTSCKLKPIDTVLVAMYGGFNQIGRTGILKVEAATNQAIASISVDKSIISPEYLHLVLNANINYWKTVAVSSRKDPNITKGDVENFPVPVIPLKKQSDLVNSYFEINNSIDIIKLKIATSQALQKSLINQIF